MNAKGPYEEQPAQTPYREVNERSEVQLLKDGYVEKRYVLITRGDYDWFDSHAQRLREGNVDFWITDEDIRDETGRVIDGQHRRSIWEKPRPMKPLPIGFNDAWEI